MLFGFQRPSRLVLPCGLCYRQLPRGWFLLNRGAVFFIRSRFSCQPLRLRCRLLRFQPPPVLRAFCFGGARLLLRSPPPCQSASVTSSTSCHRLTLPEFRYRFFRKGRGTYCFFRVLVNPAVAGLISFFILFRVPAPPVRGPFRFEGRGFYLSAAFRVNPLRRLCYFAVTPPPVSRRGTRLLPPPRLVSTAFAVDFFPPSRARSAAAPERQGEGSSVLPPRRLPVKSFLIGTGISQPAPVWAQPSEVRTPRPPLFFPLAISPRARPPSKVSEKGSSARLLRGSHAGGPRPDATSCRRASRRGGA